MAGAEPQFRLSIVVPVHDESDSVEPLVAEIAALGGIVDLAEIIFVDDASSDDTAARLALLRRREPLLRLLRHRRRAGQSAAIRSGVRAARAPWIVTLDGDGQNDPADIPRLVAAAAAAPRPPVLVGGLRLRRHDRWSRRAASRIANGVRGWLLGDRCPDTGCSLKLFGRDRFLALPYFDGMHRFLPALFGMTGEPVLYLPVNHRPRRFGRTKYGNWRRGLIGAIDLLGVRWLQGRSTVVETSEEP
jgi:dolichol-phosphate mannosyltransferase